MENKPFSWISSSTASSKFSETEDYEIQYERAKNAADTVLDFMFSGNLNDSISDETPTELELSFGRQMNSINFSNHSNLTVRRSLSANVVSSWDEFKKAEGKNLSSFGKQGPEDDVFLSSDIAKDMLLKDQEDHEVEYMHKGDGMCTPHSAWSIWSRRSLPDISMIEKTDDQTHLRRVTLSEYMKKRSESVGTISRDPLSQKVYFGFNASTPATKRRISFDLSDNDDMVLKTSMDYHHESTSSEDSVSPFSAELMPLYSLPPSLRKTEHFDISYGSLTSLKYIAMLRAEERRKSSRWASKMQFSSFGSNNTTEPTIGLLSSTSNSNASEETTLRLLTERSNASSHVRDSVAELLEVQPRELTLDVSSGCRLLLINNSKKNLKFKAEFDGKMTNVCPLSGNLPAKGQIGLRVLVSRFVRDKMKGKTKNQIEDQIKIICGNLEKIIPVKICQKRNERQHKERSCICF